MSTAQWAAVASVAAVVVSAFAIVFALMGVRDQLRVTVFLTYTERYAKIMNRVPFEARRPGVEYEMSSRPEEERKEILIAFREYFNLCSEEMWLHDHRRIDHATWRVWERGIRQVAQFPVFREAWEFLASEYDYYERFQKFVTEIIFQNTVSAGTVHETEPASEPTAQET